jgi:hypothetical protein
VELHSLQLFVTIATEKSFSRAAEKLFHAPTVSLAVRLHGAGARPHMNTFPSAGHLSSLAGLCPGIDRAPGKTKAVERPAAIAGSAQ